MVFNFCFSFFNFCNKLFLDNSGFPFLFVSQNQIFVKQTEKEMHETKIK